MIDMKVLDLKQVNVTQSSNVTADIVHFCNVTDDLGNQIPYMIYTPGNANGNHTTASG